MRKARREMLHNSSKVTQLVSRKLGFKARKSLPRIPITGHHNLWSVLVWDWPAHFSLLCMSRKYISQLPDL